MHTQRNYADQALYPDPESFRVIPWLPKTASVVCLGYEYDGEPQRSAPRCVFSELVREANALGYDVVMGHEYEYYLLNAETKQRLYEGIHIFHTVRNHYAPFLDQLVPTLRAYGIDVITHNCEYAGSQYETVYGPGVNVGAADKAFALQERHEGARAPQRLHRELHGKTVRRDVGLRLPSACQPGEPADEEECLLRRGRGGRALGCSARHLPRACLRMRRR